MRRHLLVGLVLVAGCSSTPSPGLPTSNGQCARAPRLEVGAGDPPPAVLHDLAGAPDEFLVGIPGKSYVRVHEPNLVAAPIIAGGGLFFSVRDGQRYQSRFARYGECSTAISTGYLGPVDPKGRAAVIYDAVGNRARIVTSAGKALGTLSQSAGNWTNDGRLVVRETTGLALYDLAGKRTVVTADLTISPSGALGPHGEIVTTSQGDGVIDLQTGHLTLIGDGAQRTSGSADGTYVAGLDASHGWHLKRLSDGMTTPLPLVGPPLASSWSPDSRWLAIETMWGGELLRISDGHVTDLGPLLATF